MKRPKGEKRLKGRKGLKRLKGEKGEKIEGREGNNGQWALKKDNGQQTIFIAQQTTDHRP